MKTLNDLDTSLTDTQGKMEPISLLIGADIAGLLYTENIHQISNRPTAIETKLGWTLMGRSGNPPSAREKTALTVLSMFARDAKLSDLWELDVLGIPDPTATLSKEAHLSTVKNGF